MRLIDADAFKREQCLKCDGACDICGDEKCLSCKDEYRCDFIKELDNAPTVDAVPKGKWIEENGIQICPFCGEEHEWENYRAPFCDQCGADLRGDNND